jgi:hypothetical protein
MLAPILASVAILAGLGSSHRMGEQSPAFAVSADAWLGESVRFEAGWDAAHKVETGDGWSVRGAADWRSGFLTLGAGYTRRQTSAWSKETGWARVGVQSGPLWLLAIVAPTSPNMESRLEARVRLRHGWTIVESRGWVGWHTTAEQIGGYAYGLSLLVGVGGGR